MCEGLAPCSFGICLPNTEGVFYPGTYWSSIWEPCPFPNWILFDSLHVLGTDPLGILSPFAGWSFHAVFFVVQELFSLT